MSDSRNYGIDFLRMICMCMIITLHMIGYGGLMKNVAPLSTEFWVLRLLYIAAYGSTNCYALISGYVMYKSKLKVSRLVELWLQIVFYTIVITAVMWALIPEVRTFGNIINAILPISRNQYWYLSSYFGMALFIPIMNAGIEKLSKETMTKILLAVLVFMSSFQTLLWQDAYKLENGCSTIWLCVLYLVGAYVAKFDIAKQFSIRKSLFIFGIFVAVTWVLSVFMGYGFLLFGRNINVGNIVSNTSPTIFLASVFFLIAGAQLHFGRAAVKLIRIFAPASLGVYIIHVHPIIWKYKIENCLVFLTKYNIGIILLGLIAAVISVYLVCSLVDIVRSKLFNICKKIIGH